MPKIEIPGEPGAAEVESVQIIGGTDESTTVVVTYVAAAKGYVAGPAVRAEVIFSSVLEYRWITFDLFYEVFPEDEDSPKFGLVEVLHSRYIENMAAKGGRRDWPDHRFGLHLHESDVRHFRLSFDDWGELIVIALGVASRQLPGNSE